MEIAPETLLTLYRTMLTIRLFEQRVAREFRTGEIPGFVHMYVGEEAVAAGVCANLDDDDYVTSTHRGHGHCIAKGCDLDRMMAEIYGREDGLCKGRGGSMHIADFSRGMLGANAIVGGGIALATGAGLASSVRGSRQVAVAFFGDGAANQGVLHESLNLAAIWKLPVIYVCENNGFAESTPASYATSVVDVASRAAGYGIPGVRRRRRRRARRLCGRARGRRARPRRRGPDAARGEDVSIHGALRRRSRALSRRRRAEDAARARRDPGPPRAPRRRRACHRRRARSDTRRHRGGGRHVRSSSRARARSPTRPTSRSTSTPSSSLAGRSSDVRRDRAHALDGRCRRRGDAAGDGGRPHGDRDGRGRRRRRRAGRGEGELDGRLLRRHQEPLSRCSGRTGCATPRSRRPASSAQA